MHTDGQDEGEVRLVAELKLRRYEVDYAMRGIVAA
jgi:hypothetical protein